MKYNIYCDESCHLENDKMDTMVLGAIWCKSAKAKIVNKEIRDIKIKFGLDKNFEIKWKKVSPAKSEFYLNLIDYFFKNNELHFRGLVVKNKFELKHREYNQDHDTWYYKMYFSLLKIILSPRDQYKIFLDIKDTKSAGKILKLRDVLCDNFYDFSRDIIKEIQFVRSNEINLIQLTDLLIGALSYNQRNIHTSDAKLKIIAEIKKRSNYNLEQSTLFMEKKFNIFFWDASWRQNE
jgi:hypothetical protein